MASASRQFRITDNTNYVAGTLCPVVFGPSWTMVDESGLEITFD